MNIPLSREAPEARAILLPILLTCIGYAFFNLGDAGLKIVGGKFHFSQIFFINGFVIAAFMTAYGFFHEGKKAFISGKLKLLLIRAALAQVTGLCNVFALPHIQLTTFYTIVFTSPFWVALLSCLFMGDRLTWQRGAVIAFGFIVVITILRPGADLFNIWSFVILGSAFAYSVQLLLIRQIGGGESRSFIMLTGSIMSMLIALPFLPSHFVMPTPYEWGLFLMMGLTGSIGLLCITYAIQAAPSASVVAPYHYTQIVWGALLGYFIFNEIPALELMIGAGLIIAAGIYLIHNETRRPILRGSGV